MDNRNNNKGELTMLNYDKSYEPLMDALSGATGGVIA